MSYTDITTGDRNCIKRFIQNRRFADALRLVPADAQSLVDYGAGNGELAVRISHERPGLDIVCFEPGPLIDEARAALASLPAVRLTGGSASIATDSVDVVCCMEVFEHLPERELAAALDEIGRILRPGGLLILGVPIEIGPPAIAKGIFRMSRRRGEFDAQPRNILRAFAGRHFDARPSFEIAPGFDYHPYHTGFDYRTLRTHLRHRFDFQRGHCSPFAPLGALLNSEIYLLARKRDGRATLPIESSAGS